MCRNIFSYFIENGLIIFCTNIMKATVLTLVSNITFMYAHVKMFVDTGNVL